MYETMFTKAVAHSNSYEVLVLLKRRSQQLQLYFLQLTDHICALFNNN